jgi:hypothetical protein
LCSRAGRDRKCADKDEGNGCKLFHVSSRCDRLRTNLSGHQFQMPGTPLHPRWWPLDDGHFCSRPQRIIRCRRAQDKADLPNCDRQRRGLKPASIRRLAKYFPPWELMSRS